jgi:hypothetical protein
MILTASGYSWRLARRTQLQDEDTTMKHTPSTTPLRRAAGLLAVLAILMMSASRG